LTADPQVTRPAVYPSLADRVVFVTGGASGIGASIVELFCQQGARTAFVDILGDEGRGLSRSIAAAGHLEPLFLECDLRDIEALEAAIASARSRLGPVTVLVNNAADDTRHPVDETSVAVWDERIAINLRPSFFAAKAVHADMKAAGGGSIVNFGSVSWMLAQGGMPGYTTAKAAIHGLTRSLARDFGPDNIRVNTLTPGWTMTKRQLELWVDEAAEAQIRESQCLKSPVLPEHIARMVLFLAADDSAMCTAQNFIVDGGWV